MPAGYQLSASAAEVSLQPNRHQTFKGKETRPIGGSSWSQRLAQAQHTGSQEDLYWKPKPQEGFQEVLYLSGG